MKRLGPWDWCPSDISHKPAELYSQSLPYGVMSVCLAFAIDITVSLSRGNRRSTIIPVGVWPANGRTDLNASFYAIGETSFSLHGATACQATSCSRKCIVYGRYGVRTFCKQHRHNPMAGQSAARNRKSGHRLERGCDHLAQLGKKFTAFFHVGLTWGIVRKPKQATYSVPNTGDNACSGKSTSSTAITRLTREPSLNYANLALGGRI